MENNPYRPPPESKPKQNSPQAGDGSRGSLDRQREQTLQGEGVKKPDLPTQEEDISELIVENELFLHELRELSKKHPPEADEEGRYYARENEKFLNELRELSKPPPLSEDFHIRLRERLRREARGNQDE